MAHRNRWFTNQLIVPSASSVRPGATQRRCWVSRDSPPWRTQLRRRPTDSRDPEVFGKDSLGRWSPLENFFQILYGDDIRVFLLVLNDLILVFFVGIEWFNTSFFVGIECDMQPWKWYLGCENEAFFVYFMAILNGENWTRVPSWFGMALFLWTGWEIHVLM